MALVGNCGRLYAVQNDLALAAIGPYTANGQTARALDRRENSLGIYSVCVCGDCHRWSAQKLVASLHYPKVQLKGLLNPRQYRCVQSHYVDVARDGSRAILFSSTLAKIPECKKRLNT